ncbi:MAG: dephospho-CoA kinase [Bacteroidota bacterium]
MPSNPVPLVGVTGGIGSGKTAVCNRFAALGRTVLSADAIARDLTRSDRDVLSAIRRDFGDGVFDPSGALIRGALATIVFSDLAKLRALNAIVHPRVFTAIDTQLASLPAARRTPYVIIEAALIFESGFHRRLDYTVVVRASEAARMQRVVSRDAVTPDEVRSRMKAQMSDTETAKLADFVIENEREESVLLEKVAFVDRILTGLISARSTHLRQ